MTVIKITKTKDSLELATKILENFFLKNENCSTDSAEFEKWKKWFLHQSRQFRSGAVSNTLYLSKISRIRTFIIANTSINPDDLFEVEKLERKKSYDLAQMEKTIPQPLTEQEISKLTRTLFSYLTTDVKRQLKVNPRVESITKRMRDKRYGFTLDSDPYKNIR